jgi:hypothetical protein
MITWSITEQRDLTDDELEVFRADMQDAIDGVVEDWGV